MSGGINIKYKILLFIISILATILFVAISLSTYEFNDSFVGCRVFQDANRLLVVCEYRREYKRVKFDINKTWRRKWYFDGSPEHRFYNSKITYFYHTNATNGFSESKSLLFPLGIRGPDIAHGYVTILDRESLANFKGAMLLWDEKTGYFKDFEELQWLDVPEDDIRNSIEEWRKLPEENQRVSGDWTYLVSTPYYVNTDQGEVLPVHEFQWTFLRGLEEYVFEIEEVDTPVSGPQIHFQLRKNEKTVGSLLLDRYIENKPISRDRWYEELAKE